MAIGTSRWTSGIVALVVAVGVTSSTALASDRSVAPALVIAATAMFACTAWARRTQVFAAKLTAWRAACGLVFAIGFAMAAARALDSAVWGLVASAGAASFALSWFCVYRSERPARAEPALAAIGLGTACALCFAIEAFVTLPLAARVWLHPFALALASLLVARLGIGWLGTVLGVLPAIGILAALASVLYTCPAVLAGPWLAALAATATAIAVRRVRPLALASASAAASFAWLALFGPAHLAIPLGLAALPLSLPASLAVSGVALAASHLHVTGPLPLFVAFAVCVRLIAAWRAAPDERRDALARWAGIVLLASVVLSVIYAAALLSTGRHPEGAVLAPIALALLATSVAFTATRARALAGLGRASALLSAGAAAAALVACPPPALLDVRAVAFATLALAAGWLLRRGLADGTPWALDGAACTLAGGYALARWHGLPGTAFADALVLTALAHAAFWVRVVAERRGSLAAGPLERVAIGAPVAAGLLTPWLAASDSALILLAVAIHFVAMARVLDRRWLALPGAAAANAALFCALAAIGFHDVLGYALPIALTVLTLVHVHADELGPRGRQVLRALVLVVLYAVCILSTFGTSPLRALVVVPAVCVLAILAGVLLRVRIYLVLGLAFLAADLGLEMLRHGIASRPLGALFLTVLGLALVATMVVFSLERERILRRYSVVLGELQTWD
jgi:hypothetical protein